MEGIFLFIFASARTFLTLTQRNGFPKNMPRNGFPKTKKVHRLIVPRIALFGEMGTNGKLQIRELKANVMGQLVPLH